MQLIFVSFTKGLFLGLGFTGGIIVVFFLLFLFLKKAFKNQVKEFLAGYKQSILESMTKTQTKDLKHGIKRNKRDN